MRTSPILVAAFLLGCAAFSGNARAQGTCQIVGERNSPAFDHVWKVPITHIHTLYDAHTRIASVASIAPRLLLCGSEGVYAVAIDGKDGQEIRFSTGLMRVTGGDADEIAGVLAHEFAHLILKHRDKKVDALKDSLEDAKRAWASRVRKGQDANKSLQVAKVGLVESITAFSRVAEREADDKGFALAVAAGFKGGGARSFVAKMINAGFPVDEGYLSTHPGLGERMHYSSRLEANEDYRQKAETHFRARDAEALRKTVDKWTERVPDSGGAAYYRALLALMTRRQPTEVSAALEDAVSYLDAEGLSLLGREYEEEAGNAAIMLCVSLFREGNRVQTLHCLTKLRSAVAVDKFREITGWRDFILPRRDASPPHHATIFAAKASDREVALSNCPHIADTQGLHRVEPWKATRKPRVPTTSRGPGSPAMFCSPDFCHCVPVAAEAVAVE